MKNKVPPISDDAKQLLLEASKDQHGYIHKLESLGGLEILTNSKSFAIFGDPRSEARWVDALEQLCRFDLVTQEGKESFRVTNYGYEIADELSK